MHTIDKTVSNGIVEYMTSDVHMDMNNMKLFKTSGDQPSVNSLLQKWSLQLRKAGSESVDTVVCPQNRSGLFLCSVSSKFGLRHAFGIDYNRKMIWDPSEKEALPLTTQFFLDLLQRVKPDEKDSIKMFELRMSVREKTPYQKYIGTKMPIYNSSKMGEVIAMKKKDDNSKGIFVMMISDDGMDLEEVNRRHLKNMTDGKVQK